MPALDLDDESIRNLGRGALEYFAGLYPLRELTFGDRTRGLIEAHGTQRAAAAAIGISPRQIRRWGHGARPSAASQANVDRAYLRIHLRLNHHTPRTPIETRLAAAFSAGATVTELGKIMEDVLIRQNRVPATLAVRSVPSFEPGMIRMYIAECSVSDGDDRGAFPFNVGAYAA